MNSPQTLHMELLSDATFGRGEGTAGQVDTEVEHDEFGIPYIGGKAVRGLLRDTWLSMRPHTSPNSERPEIGCLAQQNGFLTTMSACCASATPCFNRRCEIG